MDYSTVEEPSPWATSPQHSRTPSAAQEPPSPGADLPPSLHTAQHEEATPRTSQATTVVENGHMEEPATPTSPADSQTISPQIAQSPHAQQLPPAQQYPSQQQQQPPKAQRSAQRYHNQRARSKQEPQYKLQPKITGLDRPTRKELNIRFDVHVRGILNTGPTYRYSLIKYRQISQAIEQHNFEMFAAHMPNSESSQTTSSPQTLKPSFPLFHHLPPPPASAPMKTM